MKIAFIGQKGFPATWGGVEVHVHAVAVRLAQRGHDVTVFNRSWYAPLDAELESGVRVVTAPVVHSPSLDAISHAMSSTLLALFSGFDVMHYHCMGPSLVSWLPRGLGRKVVTTIHGLDYHAAKWGLVAKSALHLGEWSALRAAHRTVVVARHLQETYARAGHDTVYIPNGVDPVPETPLSALGQPTLLKPRSYLLFLARLEENKGAHELVEAFVRCRRRGLFAGQRLVIAGGAASESDYVKSLRRVASDDVLLVGQVLGEQKSALLSNASAFVTPSWLEGLPISLLEAMSAGLPCLASDIPAHRELLEPGPSGLLYQAGSIDGLEQGLVQLATSSEADRARLTGAARERSRAYKWDATAQSLEALYTQVLGS